MTSNLAAEEIAEHGLQLRADDLDATEGRMKGEDIITFNSYCSVLCMNTACFSSPGSFHSSNITISKQFKDKIIQPILKVRLGITSNTIIIVFTLTSYDFTYVRLISDATSFWVESTKSSTSCLSQRKNSTCLSLESSTSGRKRRRKT